MELTYTFQKNRFIKSETGTYVAEASTLKLSPGEFTNEFDIKDGEDVVHFNYVDTDYDKNGEDVTGWRYVSECGDIKVLIIND